MLVVAGIRVGSVGSRVHWSVLDWERCLVDLCHMSCMSTEAVESYDSSVVAEDTCLLQL